jgi:hypothetical protein
MLATAAIGMAGVGFQGGATDPTVLAHLEDALHKLDTTPSAIRVRLLAAYSRALTWSGASSRMRQMSAQAVEMGRAVGDPGTLATALSADLLLHFGRDPSHCADVARQLLDAAQASGDLSAQAEGHALGLLSRLELCDREGSLAQLGALQELAVESRQPLYRWYATSWEATIAAMEGRFADCERLAVEAVNIGYPLRGFDATTAFITQVSPIRWAQGRIDEIVPGLEAYVEHYPAVNGWEASRVWILAAAGHCDEARAALDRVVSDGLDRFGHFPYAMTAFAFLAHACAMLGVERYASDLYERLRPHADYQVMIQMWLAGGVAAGVVPYYLGGVAALAGEWETASGHFEDAIRGHEALGARPWLGWTYLRYAHAILDRGVASERLHARHLLSEAMALATDIGMPKLKHEAEARLRCAGA